MKPIRVYLLSTLPLLALMALASQAATPATGMIAIDCDHRYISQRDAARVLRTDNFSQTYAKRQVLYADVARACHSGARQVLLATEGDPGSKRNARLPVILSVR